MNHGTTARQLTVNEQAAVFGVAVDNQTRLARRLLHSHLFQSKLCWLEESKLTLTVATSEGTKVQFREKLAQRGV